MTNPRPCSYRNCPLTNHYNYAHRPYAHHHRDRCVSDYHNHSNRPRLEQRRLLSQLNSHPADHDHHPVWRKMVLSAGDAVTYTGQNRFFIP
ncbi:hypothetical protein L211DRAFT_839465 [Terfezia boudieri ATCC MYA-4762]|uniref:Uncharacterized protein n=1 Tax=Terfezia boudieri ATCC MYA-4762 TaxID=1051890 RepID=A0A3N4LML7_9PEZI|nr:hypothetical protein L211DRAFT_839465 [Terfezia boudieri ATCC MYA-4762]